MALSPHATLTWIGFTREGLFASYDSQMILRVFMAQEVPSESIQVEDMEWIVIMNIKRIMKEKCAAGEASNTHSFLFIHSSVLLDCCIVITVYQIYLLTFCSDTCINSSSTCYLCYGC